MSTPFGRDTGEIINIAVLGTGHVGSALGTGIKVVR